MIWVIVDFEALPKLNQVFPNILKSMFKPKSLITLVVMCKIDHFEAHNCEFELYGQEDIDHWSMRLNDVLFPIFADHKLANKTDDDDAWYNQNYSLTWIW